MLRLANVSAFMNGDFPLLHRYRYRYRYALCWANLRIDYSFVSCSVSTLTDFPNSLTWLGSTWRTGERHSQECRAAGLNPEPYD